MELELALEKLDTALQLQAEQVETYEGHQLFRARKVETGRNPLPTAPARCPGWRGIDEQTAE